MTGDPVFRGPIQESKYSPNFCASGVYTDFRFECRVQYRRQFDDGARFKVSLTFDGKTDPNNNDTHVITNGTALTVSFPSIALKGNLGKSVNNIFRNALCIENEYKKKRNEILLRFVIAQHCCNTARLLHSFTVSKQLKYHKTSI